MALLRLPVSDDGLLTGLLLPLAFRVFGPNRPLLSLGFRQEFGAPSLDVLPSLITKS